MLCSGLAHDKGHSRVAVFGYQGIPIAVPETIETMVDFILGGRGSTTRQQSCAKRWGACACLLASSQLYPSYVSWSVAAIAGSFLACLYMGEPTSVSH